MPELDLKLIITKALTPGAAESLRKASIPIEFLKTADNSLFLLQELQELVAFDKVSKVLKNSTYANPSFLANLGTFSFQRFNFSEDSDEAVHLEITKAEKRRNKVPCEIALSLLKYSKAKARVDSFKLAIDNTYFAFDIKDTYRNNYIFNIATYFYNKFELYQQVKAFFAAKQEELAKIMANEVFLKDVLSLFSAVSPTITPLEVPKENLSKELIINSITDKLLGYKSLFTYLDRTNAALTNVERDCVEVLIGERTNTLALTFNLDFETSSFTKNLQKKELTLEILNKFKNKTSLAAIICENLEASLNNYLLLASFSSNLIVQTKTKFLLKALN